jgi:hypothetical protein
MATSFELNVGKRNGKVVAQDYIEVCNQIADVGHCRC